jgi:hypothetical protein
MSEEFHAAARRAQKQLRIKPGDIFESCSYHPVLCLGIDYQADEIWGISLIDGTFPRACNVLYCGIRKLTPKQAWAIKRNGPPSPEDAGRIPEEKRWWRPHADDHLRVGLVSAKPRKRHGA